MAKGINLQIADIKTNICNVINASNLPLIVIQMTLSEIMSQVNTLTAQAIAAEREADQKEGEQDGVHTDRVEEQTVNDKSIK